MRKQVYTIQEVAALLQFSEQTIRDWVRSGRIKAARPGLRAWRIPRSEVGRLLAQLQIDERTLDNEGKISEEIRASGPVAALALEGN